LPLDTPISDRAVELLTRAYAGSLGVPGLTPRAFRHSVVVLWNQRGLSRSDIRERLGLKTDYAFRAYEPLFNLDAMHHDR
jgi:integrase